jgi:sulfur carrier protein
LRLIVNGEPHELPDSATVADLVAEEVPGLAGGRGVAVAIDAEIVPRSEWVLRTLEPGQRVELLAAMQGGA